MNAFRADQHVSPLAEPTARVPVSEMRRNAFCILVEVHEASAGDNVLFANLMLEGIEKGHLKVAAVDRELRLVVACEPAKRFSINTLTEAIEECRLLRGHCSTFEGTQETQRSQYLG